MAVFYKHKEITSLNFAGKVIAYVYYGAKLVYESIMSCFDKGFWINEQPWANNVGWKNEN